MGEADIDAESFKMPGHTISFHKDGTCINPNVEGVKMEFVPLED